MSQSARPRLRAAIIGSGLMGRWHGVAVRHAGGLVTAVFDVDSGRAADLATRLRAPVAESLERAIEACDVVHVCTPMDTHVPIVTRALAQGRSVLCEKPVTDGPDAIRALLAEAERRRVLLVPTHQFLFQRAVVRAQWILPALGEILHLDTIACTAGAAGFAPGRADRVALDILPHPLSLIERLIPGSLANTEWRVVGRAPGEIRAAAAVGGTSLGILVSCAGRPPINQLRIVLEKGTVVVDLFHGFLTVDRGRPSRWQKIGQPFTASARMFGAAAVNLAGRVINRELAYPGLRELVRAFYTAISGDGPSPIPAVETIAVADACDRIRAARETIS